MNGPELSVEHIGLASRDTVALKDWYTTILGARVVFDNGETPPAFVVSLAGEALVEIYPADTAASEAGDNKLAGWRHLALRTGSISAAIQDLAGRGVRFITEIRPAGGGGKVIFFKDLDGNLLHLVERNPESKVR